MKEEPHPLSDYERIAKAIAYLRANVGSQPGLEELARQLHLSPFHFQRLFKRWAGTTPKRFLEVLTVERGKSLLRQAVPVMETASELGLSGPSRLHDHFVQLEAVSPGEFKRLGSGLTLGWGLHDSPFGKVFVALTDRGICRLEFIVPEGLPAARMRLSESWPAAEIRQAETASAEVVSRLFDRSSPGDTALPLQVAGTNFQVAVWRALLRIPPGHGTSYGRIAEAVGRPKASRAVGTAVGMNPIAFLIPCHRVIQQSGALGGYRWGVERKQVIQLWERLQLS
ncbi:MAG: methylated-DNA--[protein]-cysteine S-methyltransferase [Opitutales bacterium]|nr:methylated-DNA--[protein]-cysteine S-methyltransferase [Opitutales bacterium]